MGHRLHPPGNPREHPLVLRLRKPPPPARKYYLQKSVYTFFIYRLQLHFIFRIKHPLRGPDPVDPSTPGAAAAAAPGTGLFIFPLYFYFLLHFTYDLFLSAFFRSSSARRTRPPPSASRSRSRGLSRRRWHGDESIRKSPGH